MNMVNFGSPQTTPGGVHEDVQDMNTASLWWADSIEYDTKSTCSFPDRIAGAMNTLWRRRRGHCESESGAGGD
jgi:hypothetical protein